MPEGGGGGGAGDVDPMTLPLASASVSNNGTNKGTGSDDERTSLPLGSNARAPRDRRGDILRDDVCAPADPKGGVLGPWACMRGCAKAVDLPPDVVQLGKSVLEEVAAERCRRGRGRDQREVLLGGNIAGARSPVQLSMHGVEVEGYGAFTDAVAYPLRDRGVCAVVGDNRGQRALRFQRHR